MPRPEKVEQVDLPVESDEFGHHAAVIGITAGRGREVALRDEADLIDERVDGNARDPQPNGAGPARRRRRR